MINQLKKISNKSTPRWAILLADLLLAILSFAIASIIIELFTDGNFTGSKFIYQLSLVLLFRFMAFLITKSYSGIIKYTSTMDAVRIALAAFIGTAGISIVESLYFYNVATHMIHPSIIIIDAFILIFMLAAYRLGFKMLHQELSPNNLGGKKQVIIYGAGEAGVLVKRSLEGNKRANSKAVAYIDDNIKIQGKSVEGLKIYSPDIDFRTLINEKHASELIIAIQEIPPIRKKRIIEKCLQMGMEVKTIPPVSSWIDGELNPKNIRKVKIEDLLERDPIQLSKGRIKKELKGQVILITGAAGSIGSEIARQCLQFKPKKLVLLDQGESPLYEIENELNSDTAVEVVIADVCNTSRIKRVFEHFKPTYVFHAAAYKHVPLMEDNPYEAINTNVFGTQNIANLAVEYKAKKFVFVSTDKAVNPTNIMGASKRIAEIYVQSLNAKLRLETDVHTKFVTTRFGNVLGSNGSVIPIFKKQIEDGGPLTVTHPEITRFFMTIPEACQLVLEAGVMGSGGEIYIFDMGESVKIADLAKKMIRLYGYKEGEDIEIKFTGLRPGEKLREELLNDKENTIGTHNPKIMIAKVPEYNYLEVNRLINELYANKDVLTNRYLVKFMKEIVPEYISNNSIYEELDKKLIDS